MARWYQRFIAIALTGALLMAMPGVGAYEALASMRVPIKAVKAPLGGAQVAGVGSPGSLAVNSLPTLGASPSLSLPAATLPSAPQLSLSVVPGLSQAQVSPAVSAAAAAPTSHSGSPSNVTPHAKEAAAAPSSIAAQRQAFSQAVKRVSGKDVGAVASKREFDKLFEAGSFTNAETAEAPVSVDKSSKRRTWLKRAGISAVAGAAAAGYTAAVSGSALAEGADVIGPNIGAVQPVASIAEVLSSWSPTAQVVAAALLPFVVYVVPVLAKAFKNRRSRVMQRVTRLALASPTRIVEEEHATLYILERKRAHRGGGLYIDRFIVKLPEGVPMRGARFKLRARITVETEILRPAKRSEELLTFDYNADGKSISFGHYERNIVASTGQKNRVASRYFPDRSRAAEAILKRWAPHESGKFSIFLIGAIAAFPAFMAAGLPAHPLLTFASTLVGAGLGFATSLFVNSKVFNKLSTGWGVFLVASGALGLITGWIFLWGLPAMVSFSVSFAMTLILVSRYWPKHGIHLPAGPAKAARQAASTFWAKAKLGVVAVIMLAAVASSINPWPVSAGYRAEMAQEMEEAGPTGAEYADFLREHPEVPIYIHKPWHITDGMESAVGLHRDAEKMIHPAKIFLDGEFYGLESGYWGDITFALSTLLHELDHDKQEEDLGGVWTTTSHEHSAWDHQGRFVLELFETHPEIFAPQGDTLDVRRRSILKRAQNWLQKGPQGYRDMVDSYYPKNKKMEDVTIARAEAWREYYAEHKVEMQQSWEERRKDVELAANLNAAVSALNGAQTKSVPDLRPSVKTLSLSLLFGLLSLLGVLGLERLFPFLKRLRLRRRSK
jgi:hypothetical protein